MRAPLTMSMCIPDEPMVYAIPDEPMVFALPDDDEVTDSADAPPAPGDPELVWLNPEARDDETRSVGECIGSGDVVMCVPGVADASELATLRAAGIDACDEEAPLKSKNRFSVSDPVAFGHDVVLRCEEILLRVLDWFDDTEPSIYEMLFQPSDEWAARQPLTSQGLPRMESPPSHLDDTCTIPGCSSQRRPPSCCRGRPWLLLERFQAHAARESTACAA